MSNYHVTKNEQGDWSAKKTGAERAAGTYGTQAEAEKAAKAFSSKSGSLV